MEGRMRWVEFIVCNGMGETINDRLVNEELIIWGEPTMIDGVCLVRFMDGPHYVKMTWEQLRLVLMEHHTVSGG
jgi:hypothetical protein